MGFEAVALIALAAIAAGTSAYQGVDASNQRTKQEAIARGQEADQQKMLADAKQRQKDEATSEQETLNRNKILGRDAAAASANKNGTILTNSIGDILAGTALGAGGGKQLTGQ